MAKTERTVWLLAVTAVLAGAEVWESREFTAVLPTIHETRKSACEELGGTSDGKVCTVESKEVEILEGHFEGLGGPDE
jgi:hypothetical protein